MLGGLDCAVPVCDNEGTSVPLESDGASVEQDRLSCWWLGRINVENENVRLDVRSDDVEGWDISVGETFSGSDRDTVGRCDRRRLWISLWEGCRAVRYARRMYINKTCCTHTNHACYFRS